MNVKVGCQSEGIVNEINEELFVKEKLKLAVRGSKVYEGRVKKRERVKTFLRLINHFDSCQSTLSITVTIYCIATC